MQMMEENNGTPQLYQYFSILFVIYERFSSLCHSLKIAEAPRLSLTAVQCDKLGVNYEM